MKQVKTIIYPTAPWFHELDTVEQSEWEAAEDRRLDAAGEAFTLGAFQRQLRARGEMRLRRRLANEWNREAFKQTS